MTIGPSSPAISDAVDISSIDSHIRGSTSGSRLRREAHRRRRDHSGGQPQERQQPEAAPLDEALVVHAPYPTRNSHRTQARAGPCSTTAGRGRRPRKVGERLPASVAPSELAPGPVTVLRVRGKQGPGKRPAGKRETVSRSRCRELQSRNRRQAHDRPVTSTSNSPQVTNCSPRSASTPTPSAGSSPKRSMPTPAKERSFHRG